MSKLKLLALFAVLAGVAAVVYRKLTAGDDVWQSVTDPVDAGARYDADRAGAETAPPAPSTMVDEATRDVQEEVDIERGVGEGLPAEDPFEGRASDPLTDPLPEDE